MRSHLAKAVAILLLTAFFGIPWGLYNERLREEARTMSQEQWLDMMEYTQSTSEYSTGLAGTLIITLIGCAGLVCIYEFTKMATGKFVDKVMGPETGRGI